jgi:hypothetical protein
VPKYNGFIHKEKEKFKILVKNSQNDNGNFLITKGNSIFIADKSVTVIDPNIFHLVNHKFYLLYFNYGLQEETPIGIIERKPILNSNNNIYKYNITFIFEDIIINYGLFSPYKQLKRKDCME